MKKITVIAVVFMMSVGSFISAVQASSSWKLFGLEDERIITILPMAKAGTDNLMAGTASGLWWHELNQWTNAWKGPSGVSGLTTAGDFGTVLAITGNGSDTDGVYIGTILPTGGLTTIWRFALLAKCSYPTALTFDRMDGSCTGKVYVGNISNVYSGLLCNNTIDTFDTIPAPLRPFGSICASLLVNPSDGLLYAGGYNFKGMGIVGAQDTAYLLNGTTELKILKKSETTSMATVTIDDIEYLAVATQDSGIHFIRDGAIQMTIPAPGNNESILSIVPFINTIVGSKYTLLVAATPSGVFLQCGPLEDCIWSQMDELPGIPTCLAQQDGKVLWAGTDAGIYRREFPTTIKRSSENKTSIGEIKNHGIRYRYSNGSLIFDGEFPHSHTISLFNAKGECVRKDISSQTGMVINGIGNGIYFYRLHRGKEIVGLGNVVCY